jgi:hypothetical protein
VGTQPPLVRLEVGTQRLDLGFLAVLVHVAYITPNRSPLQANIAETF